MSDWISVDDRLPDTGQWVNLYANGVVQDQSYLLEYDKDRDRQVWVNPFIEDYVEAQRLKKNHKWMPLPNPPETEQPHSD